MIPILLALAPAPAPQTANPPPPEREVVFARGSQGDWAMEGLTIVVEGYPARPPDFPATEPTIRDMLCYARRNGLTVSIGREGGLGLGIAASVTENGRARRLRPFDLRSFLLDGATWEVRTLSERDFTERFIDVAYPGPDEGGSGIQDRHLGVRRPPGNVWLPIHVLADDLLRARMLRLGLREDVRDPEAGDEDPMVWIDVPLDGLAGALSWCQRAMASPNALRLRPDLAIPVR